MPEELCYDHARYLQAKRSVDDRSLNQHVLETLRYRLDGREGLRVLEIGGGTGSMVQRVLDWNLVPGADYTLVDVDPEAIDSVDALLLADARSAGLSLNLVKADVIEFLATAPGHYDLVIANAVLDLLDVPRVLSALQRACQPDALLWFTINFDGDSWLLPEHSGDSEILLAYHQSMNRLPRRRHAGRALMQALGEAGACLLASGSSDWLVHALDGEYLEDEEYFLHHIIYTIDCELRSSPPIAQDDFATWIDSRHRSVDNAELIYMAHQLDVLATILPASEEP